MRTVLGVAMAAIVAIAASYAFSPRATLPLAASAVPMNRMHLNTLVRSGAGLVAGGELGHIMISHDDGASWQAAKLSADRQALITQIVFDKDGMTGMAVGHEGWILGSRDGGLNWQELAFDDTGGEPLMSVARLPSGAWLAVGAFGRALRSDDGGQHWTRMLLAAAGVEDKHLNRIVGSADGRQWLIVGERGLVLRSTDSGASWTPLAPFYNGSLYGAVALDEKTWVVHGMRGNVFRSSDGATTWSKSDMPAPISTFASARTSDGRLLLVGQGSMVLASNDAGASFQVARKGGLATLMDIALLADGTWLLPSDFGLQRHNPRALAAPTASTAGTANGPAPTIAAAGSQSQGARK